jgi:nucleoside-diphosphate-sugar epimerase
VAKKGMIRATMEAQYRAAAEAGMQTIIVRGGDFIAPDQPNSFLNMLVLKGIAKGKMQVPAALDVTRAWAYLPDMTRAAVALADKRADLAAFTDMPFAGFTLSWGEMKSRVEAIMGRDLKVTRFPWWAMTLAAPFWELARELREMRYLYDLPHSLDRGPMAALLPGFRMSGLDSVLAEHVERLVPQGSAMVTQTGR